MTLVLHYAPDNASLCVRLALEELGLSYESRYVDRRAGGHRSAEYRALNPGAVIPVLETADGPIFETAACLLWLSETSGRLFPEPGDRQRGAALKWLFFLSNTVHPLLRRLFYPGTIAKGAEAAVVASARTGLMHHLGLVDAAAASEPCWAEVSILHFYVAPMLRWCAVFGPEDRAWFDITQMPALRDLVARLETRPAVWAAARAEGLGPIPFTSPRPARPPEGHPC